MTITTEDNENYKFISKTSGRITVMRIKEGNAAKCHENVKTILIGLHLLHFFHLTRVKYHPVNVNSTDPGTARWH